MEKEKIGKEDLYKTLERTVAWIENCDNKTSIILGGIGVILSILLAMDYMSKIAKVLQYMLDNINSGSVLFIITTAISITLIIIGGIYLIKVLLAQTKTSDYSLKKIREDSLIYFATISRNKNLTEYKSKLMKCSDKDFVDDIISQIYICSSICTQKFHNYRKGLIFSILGFLLFVALMFMGSFFI